MSETTTGWTDDAAQAGRVANAILLGAEGLPQIDYACLAKHYLRGVEAVLRTATPPTPESDAHREVRKSVVCEKCYGLTSCWCPPTPDLDAVVARVREYLETYSWAADNRTVDRLGNDDDALFVGDARALLAAVSRPAEARGDDWTPSGVEYDRAIHHNPDAKAWADLFVQTFPRLADKHGLMLGWFANAMMAMHDSMKSRESAAPRPEPGEVSEAMVEAGVEGWIAAINDSYSLARMEHEVSRHEIVGHILRAALSVQREPRP